MACSLRQGDVDAEPAAGEYDACAYCPVSYTHLVLANSDSQEDQALKLKVRDRVLEYSEGLFQNAQTREEAEALAAAHLQELCQAAQDEVYRQGYDYPVKAEITNMFFDTREYETVTLPAGCYDALRITIGEAEGHNWW